MYFATSKDGVSWRDTRESGDPVLSWNNSQTGNSRGKDNGVRDPYLVRWERSFLIAELSIHVRGGSGHRYHHTMTPTLIGHDYVNRTARQCRSWNGLGPEAH